MKTKYYNWFSFQLEFFGYILCVSFIKAIYAHYIELLYWPTQILR